MKKLLVLLVLVCCLWPLSVMAGLPGEKITPIKAIVTVMEQGNDKDSEDTLFFLLQNSTLKIIDGNVGVPIQELRKIAGASHILFIKAKARHYGKESEPPILEYSVKLLNIKTLEIEYRNNLLKIILSEPAKRGYDDVLFYGPEVFVELLASTKAVPIRNLPKRKSLER